MIFYIKHGLTESQSVQQSSHNFQCYWNRSGDGFIYLYPCLLLHEKSGGSSQFSPVDGMYSKILIHSLS